MQKKVKIWSKTELFCTSEDGLRNIVSFVKYDLNVNSLMLLEMTDVFCIRMLIHLMIKHNGYNVIEASDVTSLWVRRFEGLQRPLGTAVGATPGFLTRT